jgi:hypothetical protein
MRLECKSRVIALCFASIFISTNAIGAASVCPDLSGTYRLKGDGPAWADAVEALDIRSAAFTGSRVRLEFKDRVLSVWTSIDGRPFSSQPQKTFSQGAGFACETSQLVFGPLRSIGRTGNGGFLSGQSMVRLSRGANNGLQISSNFHGRQQTNIYSYDSAQINIPKFGTEESINESIIWPDALQPDDQLDFVPTTKESKKEPKEVEAVQKFFNARMLGQSILGGVSLRGEKLIVVTMTSPSTEEVAALEKRLNEAEIPHLLEKKPIWTNGRYWFEMLLSKSLFSQAKP